MDIGTVIHYYDKISVAVVKLDQALHLNDRVLFRGRTTEFEQDIDSMQIQHQSIQSANGGQEVAVKVKERVRCGDTVCTPEE